MFRKPISWKWQSALGTAAILSLIAAYTALSHHRQRIDPKDRTVPSWHQIWSEGGLLKAFTPKEETGEIVVWEDFKASFVRFIVWFALSAVASTLLGLFMGCYSPLEAYFVPPLAFLSKIPATLMLTIFYVLVGLNFKFYGAMIAFGIIPTLAVTIYHAAKEDVPEELVFKARTLGASQMECVWSVILAHIFPKILEAVRLSVGPALIYLFAAEYIWGQENHGVGTTIRLQFHKGAAGATLSFGYLLLLGTLGLMGDSLQRWFQKWWCPWYAH